MNTERPPLNFEPAKVFELLYQKQYGAVCKEIIEALKHFEKTLYVKMAQDVQKKIDDFVSTVFAVYSREEFRIPDKWTIAMTSTSHLFANVVKMSNYDSTDSLLKHISSQEGNFSKILALYTCYNDDIINPQKLFDAHPLLASIWWQNYQTAPAGSLTARMHHNMTSQFKKVPEKFVLANMLTAPLYFQCTYYTPDAEERPFKEMFNQEIKKLTAKQRPIKNYPEKHKIAIISGRWQKTTAVYKSLYPMVAALRDKYELTLIHFGEHEDQIDKSIFTHVKKVSMKKDLMSMDLRRIELNGYQVAYFADIGMNAESVYLSNIRLAPIMMAGYGHPVSTFGSEVDYFIGGRDVEDASLAQQNYSERLVLIPGIGAAPVDPNYPRKNVEHVGFTINCCWTSAKINFPMLELLRDVVAEADNPVNITFFPSWTVGRYNNAIPLRKYLDKFIPCTTTIHLDKKYHDYLSIMEKGSLTLDSHPFGGYNTIVDSLFVGLPVVTIEGGQFYNRSAAALLRRVGLDDLITKDITSCKETLLRLINNPEILAEATNKLESLDNLREKLLDAPEPPGFVKAMDYLIENHERLQAEDNNDPIIIE